MCVLMVTPESSMIPRSCIVDTVFTAVLPIRTVQLGIWCWQRVDEHQSTSVLLWLAATQQDTASTHTDMLSCRRSTSADLHALYICVSSAYEWGVRWWLLTSCSRSAVKQKQNRPKDWSLRHSTLHRGWFWTGWLERTYCVRPLRYDLKQSKQTPRRPFAADRAEYCDRHCRK